MREAVNGRNDEQNGRTATASSKVRLGDMMQPMTMRANVAVRPSVTVVPVPAMTLGWVLKRAAFGLTLLVVLMGGMAWLTYASIGPSLDEAAAATKSPASLQVSAQR